jgi:hypothetical protein
MKRKIAFAIAVASVPAAACGEQASSHSLVADSSISPQEVAIYEVVLAAWLGKERGRQFVNQELSAPPSKSDPELAECTKGFDFSVAAPDQRKSLAGVQFKRKGIELIDGSKWKPADPEQGIASGESIESAVKEGFSKSLVSFSQIAFSRDGDDALVSFGMVCGGLCGSGSTIHLHKAATGWAIVGHCREWES